MGLLDNALSYVDSKKRALKRGLLDMVENPSQWAGMQSDRIQEDRYGGAENAQAMKQYLSKKPYDKVAKGKAEDALRNAAVNESLGAITVWHGSPHKFDKFDMSKIGTGEGAQAYGHGLYMADAPSVAQGYQRDVTRAQMLQGKTPEVDRIGNDPIEKFYEKIQRKADRMPPAQAEAEYEKLAFLEDLMQQPSFDDALKRIDNEAITPWAESLRSQYKQAGQLYKVDIPDEAVAKMLDWDKPLSQQHPDVVGGFRKFLNDTQMRPDDAWEMLKGSTGGEAYFKAGGRNADSTSMQLNGYGIPGIRYLDGGSRGTGAGTSNYVLFDDKLPRILETNGQATGLQPWGAGEWQGLLGK